MFQFLADRDPVSTGGKGNPEKVAEVSCQADNLVSLAGFRLPDNRVQRIIQEVRIDLGLQRSKLRFGQVILVLPDLLDQRLQAVRHLIDLLTQLTQFFHIHSFYAIAELAFRNAAHCFLQ